MNYLDLAGFFTIQPLLEAKFRYTAVLGAVQVGQALKHNFFVLDFHVEVQVYLRAGFLLFEVAKVVMHNNRKPAQCINLHFHMKI